MQYWLMKSEPSEFSYDDLLARSGQTEHWDGVRNYQARNMLRDQIQQDDLAFFYHSNCAEPGIVGIMRISRAGYPDHTALDPLGKHSDPACTPANPRWYMVDVQPVRKLKRTISLAELKNHPELTGFALLQRGSRLSILPVLPEQWNFILALE
ncbi:MAG: EVE domain-containing protein [Methylococcaceae bacterium]|nr:MAG: EVE domain-containing protein [Methylococcaceae bacterium]